MIKPINILKLEKTISFSSILLVMFLIINFEKVVYAQDQILKKESIIKFSNEIKFPFNTDQNTNYNLLESDFIIKNFLGGNRDKLFYKVEQGEFDSPKREIIERAYGYFIQGYLKINELDIIIWGKGGNDTLNLFLYSFLNNKTIDSLIIHTEIGETETIKYRRGYINENLNIKLETFIYDPKFLKETVETDTLMRKSIVTIESYTINKETGKIEFLNSEQKYSSCSPEENSYKKNCQLIDYD